MHHCLSCQRAFETRRGLGVHHSTVHDERLPNRKCDRCGEPFFSNYEKRYCSEECLDCAVSFKGADNTNYSGGKTAAECEICGATFEYYPSNKEGLYCDDCVEEERWRYRPDVSDQRHPRWSGGKRELSCSECGVVVRRHPWNITSERVFCSDTCQYE